MKRRSKRYKLILKTSRKDKKIETKEAIELVKKNSTSKFDESIDVSLRINLKQTKGGDLSLRTTVNLPNGSGKKNKIAVLCEPDKVDEAKKAGADIFGSDDLLDKIMDLNVDAVFRMCRSAIPPMKKQGEGVILNIGSMSGIASNIPQPQVAYNASKAAVHMMTKSLASDYANQNIRVNAIAPGYVKTDITNLPKKYEHWYSTWSKQTPMTRMAEPHEIASAALFLCSPASSYVTGEVLVVDGGYTTR